MITAANPSSEPVQRPRPANPSSEPIQHTATIMSIPRHFLKHTTINPCSPLPSPPTTPNGSSSLIAQFKEKHGDPTGPPLVLPASASPSDLELVLNNLLQNDEPLKYSFSVCDTELRTSLLQDLVNAATPVSQESSIVIEYVLQSTFRVRAVARCGATMAGHGEAVLSVHFAPCGEVAASGSGDHMIRIWDTLTGTCKATLNAHSGWVLCVGWSPCGRYLASGDMHGKLCVWDPLHSSKPVVEVQAHKDAITVLAWEPMHRVTAQSRLASGSRDGTVKVMHPLNRHVQFVLSQHNRPITCIKWGGEGLLYTASRDGSIIVWDESSGKIVRTLSGHGHWVNTMALSTDSVIRLGPYNHKSTEPITDVAVAIESAKTLYSARHKGLERLVSGSDDFTLYLWTPTTSKTAVARMTGHQALVNHVCFTKSGHRIASASFDKSVKVWDGYTGAFLFGLRGHVAPVYMVVFSADDRLLMSASKDSTCKVWDLACKKLKIDLPGHCDEVFAIDWSPSGNRAVSGSKDKCVKMWCP